MPEIVVLYVFPAIMSSIYIFCPAALNERTVEGLVLVGSVGETSKAGVGFFTLLT